MGLHPSPRYGIIGVIREIFDLIITDFFHIHRIIKMWTKNDKSITIINTRVMGCVHGMCLAIS